MKKRATHTTYAQVKIEVPEEDWIDFLTKERDIFGRWYIGYWAFGAEQITMPGTGEEGWICFVHDDEERPTDEQIDDVVFAFTSGGQPLPERWFFLNRDLAIKAYIEGVKRDGVDWFENGDGNRYDNAIQLAVFGELRYG